MIEKIGIAALVVSFIIFAIGAVWGWVFLVPWTFGNGWYPLTLILAAIPFFIVGVICAALDS